MTNEKNQEKSEKNRPKFDSTQAMAEGTWTEIAGANSGKIKAIVTQSNNDVARVGFYVDIAKKIASCAEKLFVIVESKSMFHQRTNRNVVQGKLHDLFRHFSNAPDSDELAALLPNRAINPLATCLIGLLERAPWQGFSPHVQMSDGRLVAEHCNDLVEAFRKEVKSPRMVKIMRDWEAVTNDKYYGTVDYLNSIFEYDLARLLILRIDLGVRVEHQRALHIFQMRDYFRKFLNNQRCKPSLFRHVEGLVWRLEHTEDKSYHYHCLVVMNGARVREESNYADRMGQYWVNEITEGKGTYWNCNRDPSRYKRSGIGMIDRSDLEKRKILMEQVVSYLTCVDEDIRLRIEEDADALGYTGRHKNVRTFGRGQIRKTKKTNRGRPRKGG
jgi:hypothetical protein